jgi:hypothetical protein
MVREHAKHLEWTYLQYCEDAGPLYWVAATVARLIMAKMCLIIYHPFTQPGKPNNLSQDIKDRLFMASIEIIEYSRILESEASTKHWGWLFHTYIQWHAIAYILGELGIRPNSTIVDRAWRAVDQVFNDWGGAVSHSKSGMLWQPMRKLMAKARRKREENMRTMNRDPGLGIDSKLVRPPAQAYSKPEPCIGKYIAQDRLVPQTTDNTNFDALTTTAPSDEIYTHDTEMMAPQIVGMGALAPDQIQLQLQQQQIQQRAQQTPWLMDDSALLDLDMSTVDTDVNWDAWDDLVKDFQMEADSQPQGGMARGPTLGGMGGWW